MTASGARVREAADRLQVWGFPLVMAQRVRLRFTRPSDPDAPRPPTSAGAAAGRLGHQRVLSDPSLRVGVAPNVDTLYSLAFLDLDEGPFRLTLPDLGDRYYCVQVGLADTGSPWALGRRTHGGQLPPLVLRRGPLGLRETGDGLECTTPHRHLMLGGRVLVEPGDPDDLARVHALQDRMLLERVEDAGAGEPAPSGGPTDVEVEALTREAETTDPAAFGLALARVLRDLDPAAVPAWVCDDLATCGLDGADGAVVDGDARGESEVARGLADGLARIDERVRSMGGVRCGWALNARGPDVGDDLLLRAAVARAQIYVNPPQEALYPVCEVDEHGAPLDGSAHAYTLTFPPGQLPPVGAFWSLTVYHAAGLLVANPWGRHAVGDRTPGLRPGPDGSLAVHLSAAPPTGSADDPPAGWLPTPEGPFRLMLRLYHPTDPAWVPPPVARVPDHRPATPEEHP